MFTNLYRPNNPNLLAQDNLEALQESQLIVSLVVANKPGVLGRIALVFSRRGFNIEYLNVHHTLDRRFSHMVVMSHGESDRFHEIVKQCQKIIDVIHVAPYHQKAAATAKDQAGLRIEIECVPENKQLILQCIQHSSFRIVDFKNETITIEKDYKEHTDEGMLTILKHYANIRMIPSHQADQLPSMAKGAVL